MKTKYLVALFLIIAGALGYLSVVSPSDAELVKAAQSAQKK